MRLYIRRKALLASDCYSVGTCSCLYNKEDRISWYWQRKNLIQFREVRQTTHLHVKLNKLQGGSSTRVRSGFKDSISVLHGNGALLQTKLLHNRMKKKNQCDSKKLSVCEYLSFNLCSTNCTAPFSSKQSFAGERMSNHYMSLTDPHR